MYKIVHIKVDPIYPTQILSLNLSTKPEFKNNYIKFVWAGVQAASDGLESLPIGMKWMITGNVPVSAGLSSSSALVVVSGIATTRALN
jgi:galactokinase